MTAFFHDMGLKSYIVLISGTSLAGYMWLMVKLLT